MDDAQLILELKEKVRDLEERLIALEREQRLIREDILADDTKLRMQKRILEKPSQKRDEVKEKIDKNIKIEI